MMISVFRAKNKGLLRENAAFSDIKKSVRNQGAVIR